MDGFSLDDILYPENPQKAICVDLKHFTLSNFNFDFTVNFEFGFNSD